MSMFANARGFQIYNGQFSVAGRDINNWYASDPLHLLWTAIKDVGASHNSETRYPPPQCHPDTRREVIQILQSWINSTLPEDRIFWLYGPAGAGKSAIAQTIAEAGQREGFLAGSFFFSRNDPRRNNPNSLVLSLAHSLAYAIPELQGLVEDAIRRNPAVIQATLEDQFRELIIDPCRLLPRPHCLPWLLVIDGLDECIGSSSQQRILSILASALPEDIPFRILICSRPEPPIREVFNTEYFRPYLMRVALDDTFSPDKDIRLFLVNKFEQIRKSPRNCHIPFPAQWPAGGAVYELVHKACGQFIYAATVVKFVDDEYSNPCTQLEVVLCPLLRLDPDSCSPLHDLDILYHQILSTNPRRSKLRDVICAIASIPLLSRPSRAHYRLKCTPRHIEALLLLREGDVLSILRGMHSILDIGGPDDEIQTFHAAFDDFLRDEARSGYFYVGDEQRRLGFLGRCLLHAIDHYFAICGGDEDALSPTQ
ncbi:hypothetical protein VNI00_011256 [Paramarasmius palmivorus]|uniref:NACHT domain-containing protein n=1 Tax=Paramarasmius palmivorus TaxID=297713 RepID=A0AAW0CEI7_9AGAR